MQSESQRKGYLMRSLGMNTLEFIKILCPPLGIPIEMGKRWLETAQKQK
ncbi:MAG: hypothetical protein KME30_18165 [Iphinoe sp. HA4291-MV1]|jgi:hypothetical protein|nr:hypothetical protein [Iphinoe sp. HA4291-MV1]